MAWEISHSVEAWDNARRNLGEWDRERLILAITDDAFEAAEQREDGDPMQAADSVRELIGELPHDLLVDRAVELIEEHRTCDNGGFSFWIDREGFHTVSVGE